MNFSLSTLVCVFFLIQVSFGSFLWPFGKKKEENIVPVRPITPEVPAVVPFQPRPSAVLLPPGELDDKLDRFFIKQNGLTMRTSKKGFSQASFQIKGRPAVLASVSDQGKFVEGKNYHIQKLGNNSYWLLVGNRYKLSVQTKGGEPFTEAEAIELFKKIFVL